MTERIVSWPAWVGFAALDIRSARDELIPRGVPGV